MRWVVVLIFIWPDFLRDCYISWPPPRRYLLYSDEFKDSLPVCESVCENFFRVCGYDNELWKCNNNINGVSLNINNQFDVSGYFPGQPFQKNEYIPKSKEPKIVCTPSIKGGALGTCGMSLLVGLLGLFVSLSLLLVWFESPALQ